MLGSRRMVGYLRGDCTGVRNADLDPQRCRDWRTIRRLHIGDKTDKVADADTADRESYV